MRGGAPRWVVALRRHVGRWGLWVALAALPVYFAIHDLTHGYQSLAAHGTTATRHDLTQLGFNFVEGLSNGSIWALIAMGYTLVYGIIRLINFAHGDMFMIGSFTSVALWGAFGLTAWPPGPWDWSPV